jgi:hypothetical protein
MYKWIGMVLLMLSFTAQAQELNCDVKINFERITDANPQVFRTLERSLTDFVNNTRWTTRNFARNERIECSMYFNISAYDSNTFSATLQVQSSRPVFNSTYSSPIFNFNDKEVSFLYTEGESLFFNPNSFNSNLISLVAYYAQIIIAMDADSYKKNGGTEYYTGAQNVVTLAQQSGYRGWAQEGNGNQNRYFLINDLLSNTFGPFRESLYEYHFSGLDKMADNPKEAKQNTAAAIKTLARVHNTRPNAFLTRVFFDAKSDEVVSIFSGGPSITVTDLVENLNRISPLNSTKWNNIR